MKRLLHHPPLAFDNVHELSMLAAGDYIIVGIEKERIPYEKPHYVVGEYDYKLSKSAIVFALTVTPSGDEITSEEVPSQRSHIRFAALSAENSYNFPPRSLSQDPLVRFAARKSPRPRIFHSRSPSQRRLVRFAAQNIVTSTHFMQRGASQGLLVGFAAQESPRPRIFHSRSLSQRRLVRFAAQNIARTTHFMQRGVSQGLLVGFAKGIIKRTAMFMQRGVSGGAFICFATGVGRADSAHGCHA